MAFPPRKNGPASADGPPGGGPPPMMPGQGMPRPGQGIDPMMAMMGGLGMPPPGGPPMMGGGPGIMGPEGLPPGGMMPGQGADLGNSDLLAALVGGSAVDGMPSSSFDPTLDTSGMGQPGPEQIDAILEALALAQMGGLGGGAGSSGVANPPFNPGVIPPGGFPPPGGMGY